MVTGGTSVQPVSHLPPSTLCTVHARTSYAISYMLYAILLHYCADACAHLVYYMLYAVCYYTALLHCSIVRNYLCYRTCSKTFEDSTHGRPCGPHVKSSALRHSIESSVFDCWGSFSSVGFMGRLWQFDNSGQPEQTLQRQSENGGT